MLPMWLRPGETSTAKIVLVGVTAVATGLLTLVTFGVVIQGAGSPSMAPNPTGINPDIQPAPTTTVTPSSPIEEFCDTDVLEGIHFAFQLSTSSRVLWLRDAARSLRAEVAGVKRSRQLSAALTPVVVARSNSAASIWSSVGVRMTSQEFTARWDAGLMQYRRAVVLVGRAGNEGCLSTGSLAGQLLVG